MYSISPNITIISLRLRNNIGILKEFKELIYKEFRFQNSSDDRYNIDLSEII